MWRCYRFSGVPPTTSVDPYHCEMEFGKLGNAGLPPAIRRQSVDGAGWVILARWSSILESRLGEANLS